MDYRTFQKEVVKRKRWLTSNTGATSFYKLYEKSKTNGRLRNNFVFYILSNRLLFYRFKQLTSYEHEALVMYENLFSALLSSKNENGAVKEVAIMLLKRYFPSVKASECSFVDKNICYEMKKYLKTMVNQYKLEQTYSPEDEEYYTVLMSGNKANELLVSTQKADRVK